MATITASGRTKFGEISVRINGGKRIQNIKSSSKVFEDIARIEMRYFDGTIANGYLPEEDSMLRAYLYLCDLFGSENVQLKGRLEPIPCRKGVIY